jgi:hypothetical protein
MVSWLFLTQVRPCHLVPHAGGLSKRVGKTFDARADKRFVPAHTADIDHPWASALLRAPLDSSAGARE